MTPKTLQIYQIFYYDSQVLMLAKISTSSLSEANNSSLPLSPSTFSISTSSSIFFTSFFFPLTLLFNIRSLGPTNKKKII